MHILDIENIEGNLISKYDIIEDYPILKIFPNSGLMACTDKYFN